MKSRRSWWLIFWAGTLCVMAALVWVSAVVLELEQRENIARADARFQESLRLALWRMDSWFAPRLAREAARPYFEYLAFYPQERAYTKILNVIEKGEVLTPSPLLSQRSEFFPIYFQINADGSLTSPQVPTQSQRDLAEATLVSGELIDASAALLNVVRAMIERVDISQRIGAAETQLAAMSCEPATPPPQVANAPSQAFDQQVQTKWSQQELSKRAQSYNNAQKAQQPSSQQLANQDGKDVAGQTAARGDFSAEQGVNEKSAREEPVPPQVTVGSLVPLWLQGVSTKHESAVEGLIFIRRVQVGDKACMQGFLVDWSHLRPALLEQISDLFPKADLALLGQIGQSNAESDRALASIPVTLRAPREPIALNSLITPARTTLGITWLAAAIAVAATGITLRSSIIYGEKRSRFASAVTHELRTPLTTFRMYSEMLAEGMVRDEAQRQTYLNTLKSESGRLATLVENVLSYARLEDGRIVTHVQSTTVAGFLDRLQDVLRRRAADAGMELRIVNEAGDAPIALDIEAAGQILFNLVDNACKYANQAADRTIELTARLENRGLCLMVLDHGPGIATEHARSVFAPFERGPHKPGDTIPGVGLGLALARGLARDLGGELTLDCDNVDHTTNGACFKLRLPIR